MYILIPEYKHASLSWCNTLLSDITLRLIEYDKHCSLRLTNRLFIRKIVFSCKS